MENGWIKLHRKAKESGIMKDPLAWTVFSYILMSVDRKTGKYKTGRFILADAIGANPITIYKSLLRLAKNYKVVTLSSNNKYTEISVINWDKYQSSNNPVTQSGNNEVTTKEQQSNTIQEVRSKKKEDIYIIADKQQSPKKEAKWIRPKDPNKWTQLQKIVYHLEDTLHAPITNWGKQAKALKMALKAGYTEEQIIKAINFMSNKDTFFSGIGFDLMTVVNNLPRYKAESNKRKGGTYANT